MARSFRGVLDTPSGTVGPSVWCRGKKRNAYVRALPLGYHDAKTAAQLQNRAKMKTVMAFLSSAKEFVNHNMEHQTKNESATNRAMKMNFHHVIVGTKVEGGKHGGKVVADYANSTPEYEELRLSEGNRFGLDSAVVLLDGNALEMSWMVFESEGRSEGSDRVNVFVYNATRHRGLPKLNASERSSERMRIALPEKWGEEELHVYVSVSDKWEGQFSDSQHFGFLPEGLGRGLGQVEGKEEERVKSYKRGIKEVSECYQSAVERGGIGEAVAVEGASKGLENREKGGEKKARESREGTTEGKRGRRKR